MNTFTDWISAWSAALTACLTFGVLVAAVWAATAARDAAVAARDTLSQMKADSEGQRQDSARATRPYVHARMVPSIAGLDTWDLVVENSGRTAAYELTLGIKSVEGARAEPVDIVTGGVRKFAETGHTLHPGASVRMYWTAGATEADPTGFPPSLVTVHYVDSEGARYAERPVLLDPNTVGMTPVPGAGPVRGNDRDAHLERNTLNALRAIARNVGEGNR